MGLDFVKLQLRQCYEPKPGHYLQPTSCAWTSAARRQLCGEKAGIRAAAARADQQIRAEHPPCQCLLLCNCCFFFSFTPLCGGQNQSFCGVFPRCFILTPAPAEPRADAQNCGTTTVSHQYSQPAVPGCLGRFSKADDENQAPGQSNSTWGTCLLPAATQGEMGALPLA